LEAFARAGEIASLSSINSVANLVSVQRQKVVNKLPSFVSDTTKYKLSTSGISESVLGGKGFLFGTEASQALCTELAQNEALEAPMDKMLHAFQKVGDRLPFHGRGGSQSTGRGGGRLAILAFLTNYLLF